MKSSCGFDEILVWILRIPLQGFVSLPEDFGEFLFKHIVAKVDVDNVALAVKKDIGRDALDVVSLRAKTVPSCQVAQMQSVWPSVAAPSEALLVSMLTPSGTK